MKLLTILLAIALTSMNLISSNLGLFGSNDQAPKDYEPLEYLQNTYYRLTNDKELNIVYVGGSVTDGYGSSNQNTKSWRHLTTQWFKKNFPDANITDTKASIGGTGSYLASFRFEREIKPHNPDLLFIEFAINDYYGSTPYDKVVRASETLVRKAYEANPHMDIIYVLTFDVDVATSDYESLRAHRDVANKYGLMSIKLSDYFYPMLSKTRDNFYDYFADGVHPNDNGYAYYASVICDCISQNIILDNGTDPSGITLKEASVPEETLSKEPLLLDARMIYSNEIDLSKSNGWSYQNENFSWLRTRYNGRLFANTVGSSLEFEVEGTDIGLCYGCGPAMGTVTCTVDNGKPVVINAQRSNTNPCDATLAWNLEYGKHTVKIELTGTTPEGNSKFEIGAILVS